jgi:hypothetical protein
LIAKKSPRRGAWGNAGLLLFGSKTASYETPGALTMFKKLSSITPASGSLAENSGFGVKDID